MFPTSEIENHLDDLQDRLKRARVVTPDLMSNLVAGACARVTAPSHAIKAEKIDRLIELEAWTEAALALVDLELPLWKLRRLIHEDGAWHCSLSRQWNLPVWLSDDAEARHESLPLAILSALIEARRCGAPSARPMASSVPRCGVESSIPLDTMCCDNFA